VKKSISPSVDIGHFLLPGLAEGLAIIMLFNYSGNLKCHEVQ